VSAEGSSSAVAVRPPAASPEPGRSATGRTGAGRGALLVALVAGLVAMLGAIALPLAPVTVNQPVVSWPEDPAVPESTALLLTTYQPRALDVRFSCDAARQAALNGSGLLLSTVAPMQPDATQTGLLVSAADGRLTVDAAGTRLVDAVLGPGECSYRIRGGAAGLVVSRDGSRVAVGPADAVPEVEVLQSGITALPGAAAGDLSVRVEVDDRFSTSPTPLKVVLIGLVGVALVGSLVAAGRLDRAMIRGPAPRSRWRPAVSDVAVLIVMVGWLFLAPTTDDDGYYAAMAENAPFEGYVANYYQLYNQSFTPFTWVYVALSKWQLLGESPVLLRIPALLCGLLTWVLLRRFVSGCLTPRTGQGALPRWFTGRRRWIVRATLAVVFLTWWLPQDMGVRPETVVAGCALGALLAVTVAVEQHRLVPAAVGMGVAALGFAAHPTGFVTLAPLLACAPALWSLVRSGSLLDTAGRLACVLAPGAVASIAGFADGSLRGFLGSQQVFLGIQDQESWYTEYVRYGYLLAQVPMGSYAKRASVLVALVALVWFVALLAAARARRVVVPQRLVWAGTSTGLAFLLLWLTPSKWTHHFGALAGIGPAFLALFLVLAPPVVFQLTRGRRLPAAVVAGAAGSAVLAVALAGHGPNEWAYDWMFGLPHASVPPYVWIVPFDQPLGWLLVLLAMAGVLALGFRRRVPHWRRHAVVVAVPLLVVGFFVATLGYLLGSFGLAAARTWDGYSLGTANLRDPLGSGCPASEAIEVLDERRAAPLRPVPGLSSAAPRPVFALGTGWFEGTPPPVAPGEAAVTDVWGSFISRAGTDTAEQNIGSWTSPWYALPADPGSRPRGELAILVSGRLGGGNSLTVQYATVGTGGARVVVSHPVDQPADAAAWRTAVLPDELRPARADAVRLVAVDSTTDLGGWLAFTAPAVHPYVTLGQYLDGEAAIATAWQIAFRFPCLRQPRQQDGITEPVSAAVLWGEGPLGGLEDAPWQKQRGGTFARIPIIRSVFQPVARFRDFPDEPGITVYRFPSELASEAYQLSRQREIVTGW